MKLFADIKGNHVIVKLGSVNYEYYYFSPEKGIIKPLEKIKIYNITSVAFDSNTWIDSTEVL